MKRLINIFLAVAVFLNILAGCAGTGVVTFSQLISQADKYNGKTVTLDAFYFSGWEVSALTGSVEPASSGPWRLVPVQPLIWVDGGIPKEIYDKLYGQTAPGGGFTERIGKLRITGKFQSGGNYGHVGGYDYQISVERAELLEWSPPPAQTEQKSINGAVTATDWNAGWLKVYDTAARKEYQLYIKDSTQIYVDGQPAGLTAITAGSAVDVTYDEATMTANKITFYHESLPSSLR